MGFANLPNQVYRKSVKRGFEFTLMVVGKWKTWTPPVTSFSPGDMSQIYLFGRICVIWFEVRRRVAFTTSAHNLAS